MEGWSVLDRLLHICRMPRPLQRLLNSFSCSSNRTTSRCNNCVRMTHYPSTAYIETLLPASQTIPTVATPSMSTKNNNTNTNMNVIVIVIGARSTLPRLLVRPPQTRSCLRRLVTALLLLPLTPPLSRRAVTAVTVPTLPPTATATLSRPLRQELRVCPIAPPSCLGP